MTINFRWFDAEKTILYYQVIGGWSVEEGLAVVNQLQEELNLNLSHYKPRYSILDLRESVGIPENVLMYRSDMDAFLSDDIIVLIVGAHPMIRTFVNVLKLLGFSGAIIFYTTLEEAQYFIQCHKEECK